MAFKQLIVFQAIIAFYIGRTLSQGLTKVWTMGDEKIINLENDNPDCINQTYVYQSRGGIYFNTPEQTNTLILPSTGSIIFVQNQQTVFIPRELKCHSKNYDTKHFKLQLNHPRSWFDPTNWRIKDHLPNKAIPHIDQIPCECDVVEIPSNHSLWIDLDYVSHLTVEQVKINDKVDNFNDFLETSLGQMMFMVEESYVTFTEGLCTQSKRCGCHNPTQFEEYFNLVCLNAIVCKEPNCIDPIQPIGHCCPICGAMTQFTVKTDRCPGARPVTEKESELENLDYKIQMAITHYSNGKYANKVDGYIGMFRGEHDENIKIQIIAVDKTDYDEFSVEFLKWFASEEIEGLHPNAQLVYSGRPYYPNRSISLWFIVFGSLLLVVAMYGTIYLYYTEDSKLRKYNPFNRFQILTSPGVFARFDNNRDGDADSIAVGVEFDENPNPNHSTSIYEAIASAFDNPMFKGRNKEKKIETIGPNALNEYAGDDDHDGESVTSVKLVEVELDSNE